MKENKQYYLYWEDAEGKKREREVHTMKTLNPRIDEINESGGRVRSIHKI